MPTNKINSVHYNGKVEIDFYPDSHRYKNVKTGEWLISNTSAIGILDKSRPFLIKSQKLSDEYFKNYIKQSGRKSFKADEMTALMEKSLRQWDEYCNEGRSIGTMFHDWAEQFAKAKMAGTIEPKIDDTMGVGLVQAISGFLAWYNSNDVKFLESEKIVYSKKYNFVGITDVIAIMNGKKTLLDYKTSKDIYDEMFWQVAGYQIAFEEEFGPIDEFMILKFCKETGEFEARPIDKSQIEENKKAFLYCLGLKRIIKARSKWES